MKPKLVLYHGTTSKFDKPELGKSIAQKYGNSFYTTPYRHVAVSYCANRPKQRGGRPYLNKYLLAGTDGLSIKAVFCEPGSDMPDVNDTADIYFFYVQNLRYNIHVVFTSQKAIDSLEYVSTQLVPLRSFFYRLEAGLYRILLNTVFKNVIQCLRPIYKRKVKKKIKWLENFYIGTESSIG